MKLKDQIVRVATCVGVCTALYYCYRRYKRHRAKKTIQNLGISYLAPSEWKPRKENLTVATWNTLRRQYKRKGYVEKSLGDWKFRRKLIRESLLTFQSDLLCLQEAEIPTLEEDFGEFLKSQGYGYIYATLKSKSSDTKHPHTKPSIFFKTDRLKLLWQMEGSRVIIAEFLWVDQGESFFVINCHCQGRASHWLDRFYQIRKWLKRLEDELRQNRGEDSCTIENAKVIFLGDFNSSDEELCHQYLLNGHIPDSTSPELLQDISDKFKKSSHSFGGFKAAYGCLSPFEPWTLCHGRGSVRTRVDYIYTKGFVTQSLRRPLEEEKSFLSEVLIPNEKYPSDHLPLATELSI